MCTPYVSDIFLSPPPPYFLASVILHFHCTAVLTIITGPGVVLHVIPRAKLKTILSYISSQPLDSPSSPASEGSGELDDFIPEMNIEHLAALELPMKAEDIDRQLDITADGANLLLGSELNSSEGTFALSSFKRSSLFLLMNILR